MSQVLTYGDGIRIIRDQDWEFGGRGCQRSTQGREQVRQRSMTNLGHSDTNETHEANLRIVGLDEDNRPCRHGGQILLKGTHTK